MMKMQRAFPALTLVLIFCTNALAQVDREQESPLRRAERTFAAADLDRDGGLHPDEIARAGIPASVLATWDDDGGRSLSRDEFLLYYRQLLINAGRDAGPELDIEAQRILALRQKRKAQEAQRKEREKELEQLRGNRSGETAEEKYRRAVASLGSKKEKKEGEGEAAEPPPPAGTRDVRSATRERVARARAALGEAEVPVQTEGDRSQAALALVRALDALEDRSLNGNWTREQYEKERLELILRARATQWPGVTEEERRGAGEALARALDAMESRARSGQWSREQYETERQELILRARGTAEKTGGGEETPGTPPIPPGEPTELARALIRALDALDDRAGNAGWSQEQLERARYELIDRARAIPAARAGEPGDEQARTRAVLALTRALEAMEARARSGGWSREQYERERLDLILRARNARTPGGGPDGGSGDSPPSVENDRARAAEALGRALDALENRSRNGGWSREMFERERLDLIVRARGLDLGVPADEAEPQQARSRAAAALARALDALADRSRNGGWSREQFERERLDLIRRARAAREKEGEEPPPSPPEDPRSDAATALVRALDALDDRARSGEWSREQFERERLDLILRARGIDLGTEDEAARSEAARALTRALDAMKDRARSGGWSREQYERQRVALIRRAAATRRDAPAVGAEATGEQPVRRTRGIDVEKVGGASGVKRVPVKEKAGGGDEGGEAERKGDAERSKDAAEGKGREAGGQSERQERSERERRGG